MIHPTISLFLTLIEVLKKVQYNGSGHRFKCAGYVPEVISLPSNSAHNLYFICLNFTHLRHHSSPPPARFSPSISHSTAHASHLNKLPNSFRPLNPTPPVVSPPFARLAPAPPAQKVRVRPHKQQNNWRPGDGFRNPGQQRAGNF